jgi:hypothetical protein
MPRRVAGGNRWTRLRGCAGRGGSVITHMWPLGGDMRWGESDARQMATSLMSEFADIFSPARLDLLFMS